MLSESSDSESCSLLVYSLSLFAPRERVVTRRRFRALDGLLLVSDNSGIKRSSGTSLGSCPRRAVLGRVRAGLPASEGSARDAEVGAAVVDAERGLGAREGDGAGAGAERREETVDDTVEEVVEAVDASRDWEGSAVAELRVLRGVACPTPAAARAAATAGAGAATAATASEMRRLKRDDAVTAGEARVSDTVSLIACVTVVLLREASVAAAVRVRRAEGAGDDAAGAAEADLALVFVRVEGGDSTAEDAPTAGTAAAARSAVDGTASFAALPWDVPAVATVALAGAGAALRAERVRRVLLCSVAPRCADASSVAAPAAAATTPSSRRDAAIELPDLTPSSCCTAATLGGRPRRATGLDTARRPSSAAGDGASAVGAVLRSGEGALAAEVAVAREVEARLWRALLLGVCACGALTAARDSTCTAAAGCISSASVASSSTAVATSTGAVATSTEAAPPRALAGVVLPVADAAAAADTALVRGGRPLRRGAAGGRSAASVLAGTPVDVAAVSLGGAVLREDMAVSRVDRAVLGDVAAAVASSAAAAPRLVAALSPAAVLRRERVAPVGTTGVAAVAGTGAVAVAGTGAVAVAGTEAVAVAAMAGVVAVAALLAAVALLRVGLCVFASAVAVSPRTGGAALSRGGAATRE